MAFITNYKNIMLGKIRNGQLLDKDNTPCTDKQFLVAGGSDTSIRTVVLDNECNLVSNYNNSYLIVDNVVSLMQQVSDLIDKLGELTDKISSGVLPSNSGGPITSTTFPTDLATVKTEMNNVKTEINKIVNQIQEDKKNFF